MQSFERPAPASIGFDAAVEFPPNMSAAPNLTAQQSSINPQFDGEVLDWTALVQASVTRAPPPYRLPSGFNPDWDKEARRSGRGRAFVGTARYISMTGYAGTCAQSSTSAAATMR